jgi:RND family efflux transporter MFP subunit
MTFNEIPARFAAGFTALCLCLVITACKEEPVARVEVAQPVKIFTVGDATSGTLLEYPGQIAAAKQADMAFEVQGRMLAWPVNEGDRVEQGTILARIDPRDYEAQLDSARAQLRKTEADLKRSESIYREDSGAISLSTLDADRRSVDVAAASYRTAEKAMEETVLRAPFDGSVARKLVEDYAAVQAKDPVLILQNDSYLEIRVDVPERDVTGVEAQGELSNEKRTKLLDPEVVVTSVPDRRFPARVKEFSTTADAVTRTFRATLSFDRPDDVRILPGMTAKVILTLKSRTVARLVPSAAVLTDDSNKPFVWVVSPASMTVTRASVELGNLTGSDVEIRAGLESGDQVAVSGAHNLRDGMQVRRFER